MAVVSVCAKLINGLDGSCIAPARKYFQQVVLINHDDIDPESIVYPEAEGEGCRAAVTFALKPGATGYRIIGPEAGASFFGSFDKSRSDLGYPQYIHNGGILIAGTGEDAKCILDSLDKGSFVAVYQLKDGTVEVFGLVNGLTTGDYTYNVQEGGGGTPIVLSSVEDAPEGRGPLVYVSGTPGDENLDFNDAFASPEA